MVLVSVLRHQSVDGLMPWTAWLSPVCVLWALPAWVEAFCGFEVFRGDCFYYLVFLSMDKRSHSYGSIEVLIVDLFKAWVSASFCSLPPEAESGLDMSSLVNFFWLPSNALKLNVAIMSLMNVVCATKSLKTQKGVINLEIIVASPNSVALSLSIAMTKKDIGGGKGTYCFSSCDLWGWEDNPLLKGPLYCKPCIFTLLELCYGQIYFNCLYIWVTDPVL